MVLITHVPLSSHYKTLPILWGKRETAWSAVTVINTWFVSLIQKFFFVFQFIHMLESIVQIIFLSGILRTHIFFKIEKMLLFFSSPGLSQTMSPLVSWMAKPHKWKCVLSLRPTRTIHKNNTRSSQSKLKSALNSLHWPLGYSSYNMICMNNFCCKVTS